MYGSKYQPVIGLEIHVQLATKSKMFSSDLNEFGSAPNSNLSALTIAHPGTLPVVNKNAISFAVKLGLALNCEIDLEVHFDRKNYFYPDLPKGYQITQDARPICKNGGLTIRLKSGEQKFISLTKIHMEEDAGKSMHIAGESVSHVDLNRAGVPLLEIVTDPVMKTSEEAALFLSEIRKIVRYLSICDGNMEQGSMRCDANVSIHFPGEPLGEKVEVKNMNSVKNVTKAIDHEIERQILIKSIGKEIVSETRTFNPDKGDTVSMRSKETLNDYRYFPEPDISPVLIDSAWFDQLKSEMPALPDQVKSRLINEFGLPEYDAAVISEDRDFAEFYFQNASMTKEWKLLSNWMMGGIKSYMNEQNCSISMFPIKSKNLIALIDEIAFGKISHSAGQKVFNFLLKAPEDSVSQVINQLNLHKEDNEETLESVVELVLSEMPDKVKEFHKGRKGLSSLFIGQVMKKTGGKADPQLTAKILAKSLEEKKN